MQNMAVDSLIENIKTKIVIKFHFINFMIYLARVANSMVIFSASYIEILVELIGTNAKDDSLGLTYVLNSSR